MFSSRHDILSEIDETIDQLIKNGKVLKKIETKEYYEREAQALEKTQESLLAHLIHMDELLKNKKTSNTASHDTLLTSDVHKKLGRSGYLNNLLEKKKRIQRSKSSTKRASKGPKIHRKKVCVKKELV